LARWCSCVEFAKNGFLAVDDDGHFAIEHDIDFFKRRRIRASATAREKLAQPHPLVLGATVFEALKSETDDTKMVRRLISLGVLETFEMHGFSPRRHAKK